MGKYSGRQGTPGQIKALLKVSLGYIVRDCLKTNGKAHGKGTDGVLEIGAKWKGGGPETMLPPRFSVTVLPYSTPLPSYPIHSPTISAPMNRLRRTLTNQNQRCRERYTLDQAWVQPNPSSRPPSTPLHGIPDLLKMMPCMFSLQVPLRQ